MYPGRETTVAIPARNEAEYISPCLRALAAQVGPKPDKVVLFLNDVTDETAEIAGALRPEMPFALCIEQHRFPPGQGGAGPARRRAMEIASQGSSSGCILLCTDADSVVGPDWLARNGAHVRDGADAVAGRAMLHPEDLRAIPQSLQDDDAWECALAEMLDAIDQALDPEPWDPSPRHTEESGASIAVTLEAFQRAGGIPAVAVGEDRAFFAALRRADAQIRHAPDVRVTVSGRLVGRAAGGMAETIRRRMTGPDPFLDDRLEPARARAHRAATRGRLRRAFQAGSDAGVVAVLRDLGAAPLITGPGTFGALWATLEDTNTSLSRARVPAANVSRELASALGILQALQPLPKPEERLERLPERVQEGLRQAEAFRIVGNEPAIL